MPWIEDNVVQSFEGIVAVDFRMVLNVSDDGVSDFEVVKARAIANERRRESQVG